MQLEVTNQCASNSTDLLNLIQPNSADSILYCLATVMMKYAGHRYGAFLDSASIAAKLTIYETYQAKIPSFRKTGNFYHVEPKRIKAIVQEVEELIDSSDTVTILGSEEPSYLIGLPYLWFKTYPYYPGDDRIPIGGLTLKERQLIEQQLAEHTLPVRLIREFELDSLLEVLYAKSVETVATGRCHNLTEPMLEHLKYRLLDAETIMRVDTTASLSPLYMLTRMSYSPKGTTEKVSNLIQDVARFFKLLLLWLDDDSHVLRAFETFEIDPNREQEALAEIDVFVRSWADRYHQEGGIPMVLQTVVGPCDNPYFANVTNGEGLKRV